MQEDKKLNVTPEEIPSDVAPEDVSADTNTKPVSDWPEKKPPTAATFEITERLAKGVALVVGLSYGLGILISNQYLLKLGISDFASVRPKYIVTGMWTMLLAMFIAAPLMSFYLKVGRFVATCFFAISLTLALLSFIGFRFENYKGHVMGSLWNAFWFIAMVWVAMSFARSFWLYSHVKRPDFNPVVSVLYFCICVLLLTDNVAKYIYGNVPESTGGGAPLPACLILNSKGMDFWRQAGIGQAEHYSALPANTRVVLIVFQDEKIMALEAVSDVKDHLTEGTGKIVVINKDLIDGFSLDPIKHPCAEIPAAPPTPSPAPSPSSSPSAPPHI